MAVKDAYFHLLDSIAAEIEQAFHLDENFDDSKSLSQCDVDIIMSYLDTTISCLPEDELEVVTREAGMRVVLLSYLSSLLKFHGLVRLDFSAFPCMKDVTQVLLCFTKKETITEESYVDVNKIVQVLLYVDQHLIQHRFGLAYRYLRIFLLLLFAGSYDGASIVASFILEQVIVNKEV